MNEIVVSKSEIHLQLYPGGFSREGNPLIILPDTHLFFEVLESDLHLVLKYFIQIIPMAKQVRNKSYIETEKLVLLCKPSAVRVQCVAGDELRGR